VAISNTDLRLDKAEGFDEMWKVGTEEPKRQQLRSRGAEVDYVMPRVKRRLDWPLLGTPFSAT
jgi:hypothetical protein